MKKSSLKQFALGNSAFVTGAVVLGFSTGVAMAGDAPKLTVGGSITVVMDLQTINSNDKTTDNTGEHAINNPDYLSALNFKTTAKTDSGLEYGTWLNILPGLEPQRGGMKVDEASLNFGGEWGKIRLGQDDSWAFDNAYRGSSVLAGFGHWGGAYDKTKIYTDFSFGLVHAGFGDDDAKITYSSPKVNGLSAGVTYVPAVTNPADLANTPSLKYGFGNQPGRDSTNFHEMIGVGAKYETQIGDIKSGTSFNVTRAVSDNKNFYNHKAYHFGQQVEMGNIKVATSYADYGRGVTVKNAKEYVDLTKLDSNPLLPQLITSGILKSNFEAVNAGYQEHLPRVFDVGVSYTLKEISDYTKISFGFSRSTTQMKKGQIFEGVAVAAGQAAASQTLVGAVLGVSTPVTPANVVAAQTALASLSAAQQTTIGTAIATNTALAQKSVRDAAGQQLKNSTENGFQVGFFTPLAEGLGTFAEYNTSIQDNGRSFNNKSTVQSFSVGALVWF